MHRHARCTRNTLTFLNFNGWQRFQWPTSAESGSQAAQQRDNYTFSGSHFTRPALEHQITSNYAELERKRATRRRKVCAEWEKWTITVELINGSGERFNRSKRTRTYFSQWSTAVNHIQAFLTIYALFILLIFSLSNVVACCSDSRANLNFSDEFSLSAEVEAKASLGFSRFSSNERRSPARKLGKNSTNSSAIISSATKCKSRQGYSVTILHFCRALASRSNVLSRSVRSRCSPRSLFCLLLFIVV